MAALTKRICGSQGHEEDEAYSEYGIKMQVVKVFPEVAQGWLERAMPNRKISQQSIKRFKASMKEGRWALGPALLFTKDWRLLDGQTRLNAVILSEMPVLFICIVGLPPGSFAVIDDRKARSAGDIAGMLGEKSVSVLMGAIRIVRAFDRGITQGTLNSGAQTEISNDEVEELLKKYHGISDSMVFDTPMRKFPRATMMIGCHYIFSRIDKVMADKFFTRLSDGEGLSKGDPIYVLRERLISDRATKNKKMARITIYSLTVKAWNAYREGRSVARFGWAENEGIPDPI